MESRIQKLQDIIGTDAGGRGMKSLIVPGDLLRAAQIFSSTLLASSSTVTDSSTTSKRTTVLVLSGFPCCVSESPPTETDGPPGTLAIGRAAVALGARRVVIVTDDCNRAVFAAAAAKHNNIDIELETFPAVLDKDDEERLQKLADECCLIIACERAGPGADGKCYTMRGIDMNAAGLIAPLHRLVVVDDEKINRRTTSTTTTMKNDVPFVAIGDGGNELGMGKSYQAILDNPKIANGAKIGCVVAADHLIAASVSNWGGYALAAATALVRAAEDPRLDKKKSDDETKASDAAVVQEYVDRCLPTEQDEIELLDRCVAAGCRDGVSGKMEATVDGMPLETSLQCLRDIRAAALGKE